MKRLLGLIVIALTAGAGHAGALAPALAPLPMNEQQVQEQLKTFDPTAVAAVRHYFENPAMKRASLSKMQGVMQAINTEAMRAVRQQEKTPDDKALVAKLEAENSRVVAAASKAATGNYEFITSLQLIAALQTFSTDEIVALDAFYNSPTGQAIVGKMPVLSRRMPEVKRVVMPRLMAVMKVDDPAGGGKP